LPAGHTNAPALDLDAGGPVANTRRYVDSGDASFDANANARAANCSLHAGSSDLAATLSYAIANPCADSDTFSAGSHTYVN